MLVVSFFIISNNLPETPQPYTEVTSDTTEPA